jgi:2-octaprenyl-6-methoxyphenol hydroxylase
MLMTLDFDIAICGAGPVGMALANMLVQRGTAPLRVALIDARTIEHAVRDPRTIAVSHGSQQLLDDVGAWPATADPIHTIHVSRRGHFGRTLLDRDEYDVPALGYVTRYGALVSSLASVAHARGIPSLRPAQVTGSHEHADHVALQLADGSSITAAIAVQAEGGLFSDQGAKSVRRDYDQTAIIGHVMADAPFDRRAFERFTSEGPLALLPQDGGYALVWCGRPASVERLMALSDREFLAELQDAFGNRVGRFTQVGPRNAYPLGLNAQPAATARTIAIGNAAQTLHPVAGQGFNLGLRDAAVLARLLAREATPDQLLQFIASRQGDRSLTIALTDAMARVFAGAADGSPMQSVLGCSLALFDAFKPAKRLLAEHMMFGRRQ